MVVGTGVDLVEVSRIRGLRERHGDRFLRRWFDDREIAYCEGRAHPDRHLAARFAAKEAAFKALRLSRNDPVCWRHIIVEKETDGSPVLLLTGEPREAAARMGITRLHISLSHCEHYALAMVTAER